MVSAHVGVYPLNLYRCWWNFSPRDHRRKGQHDADLEMSVTQKSPCTGAFFTVPHIRRLPGGAEKRQGRYTQHSSKNWHGSPPAFFSLISSSAICRRSSGRRARKSRKQTLFSSWQHRPAIRLSRVSVSFRLGRQRELTVPLAGSGRPFPPGWPSVLGCRQAANLGHPEGNCLDLAGRTERIAVQAIWRYSTSCEDTPQIWQIRPTTVSMTLLLSCDALSQSFMCVSSVWFLWVLG